MAVQKGVKNNNKYTRIVVYFIIVVEDFFKAIILVYLHVGFVLLQIKAMTDSSEFQAPLLLISGP